MRKTKETSHWPPSLPAWGRNCLTPAKNSVCPPKVCSTRVPVWPTGLFGHCMVRTAITNQFRGPRGTLFGLTPAARENTYPRHSAYAGCQLSASAVGSSHFERQGRKSKCCTGEKPSAQPQRCKHRCAGCFVLAIRKGGEDFHSSVLDFCWGAVMCVIPVDSFLVPGFP